MILKDLQANNTLIWEYLRYDFSLMEEFWGVQNKNKIVLYKSLGNASSLFRETGTNSLNRKLNLPFRCVFSQKVNL